MVQFRFIADSSPVSHLVRALPPGWKYSHVDLIVPGQGYLGARLSGGVQIRDWNYINPTRQLIAQADVPDENAFWKAAFDQIGKKYDWSAIIANYIFDRDWRDESRWYCSELGTWLLEQGNKFLFKPNVHINKVWPDLMLVPNGGLIY